MKSSDLEQYFDLIVSGFDFKRSKPDPEIYLTSAAKLNSAVEECLVVEDSPCGIKAGKNAGRLVAARNDHVFGFDQSEADFHFDTLEDLEKILRTINS